MKFLTFECFEDILDLNCEIKKFRGTKKVKTNLGFDAEFKLSDNRRSIDFTLKVPEKFFEEKLVDGVLCDKLDLDSDEFCELRSDVEQDARESIQAFLEKNDLLIDTEKFNTNILLNDVMTLKEAALLYGKATNTLRFNIQNGFFKEGIDCRKSGGTWIILKSALDREYGEIK